MSIYAGGDKVDYSALKGPCPDGYHVPTLSEFSDLVSKFLSFGLSRGTFYTYYKVPMAGLAGGDSGYSIKDTGTKAQLVLATAYSDDRTYYAYVTTGYVAANYKLYKGYYGYSLRPFKDEPAIPDSNWTVLYQGTGNAGIYYNATEGLISLSTDGTNWITVADKNLGATTVYNSGDTLSEANCGKFYQWGNNYGFPGVGSDTSGVVTSSTKVDAGSYGPGEYSSSTFIITGADWSSVTNNNLWGGVTGVIQIPKKVKEIYVSQQEVPRLPDTYQEVAYIESHGDEYIDTGIMCVYGSSYDIHIDFKRLDQDEDAHYIFGYLGHMKRGLFMGFGRGDFYLWNGRSTGPVHSIDYGGFTYYQFTPNTYGYDTRYDFIGTFDTGDVDASDSLHLLNWRNGGASAKIYECQIEENGVQTRDFVPCYRKSDGEIGLYDMENDVFYANAGSGAFTKGPPLGIKSIKEVYKGNTKIRPGPNLLSYQEIIDMGENDLQEAIDELNSHQTNYYNKFQSEGHIYTEDGVDYLGVSGEGLYVMGEGLMTYTEAMDMFGEYFTIKYDPEGPIYGYTVWTEEMVGHEVPDDSL